MNEHSECSVILWKSPQDSMSKLRERLKNISTSDNDCLDQKIPIEQTNTKDSATIYAFPEKKSIQSSSCVSSLHRLEDFSSEEIIRYRLLLEASYRDPEQDKFHDNDLPQRFREGTHTFSEMEKVIADLITKIQNDNTPPWVRPDEISYIRYLDRQGERQEREKQGLLTQEEEEIILTYPEYYHDFMKELLQIAKLTEDNAPYSFEELGIFRHNLRWLFVRADQEWHHARLKTLLADRWIGEEIIRYMMFKKVKYILCHNSQIIQSLGLNNEVVVFEKH
jgi:hypothetical protein